MVILGKAFELRSKDIMLNEISIDLDQYWYKYYAMIDYWTPEEAVTLACNLNPQCKIETVKILKAAGEDVPLMDLLIRAIECDKIIVIDNRIRPLDFIKWCKSKDRVIVKCCV